jgi:hypothetical protein
LGLGGVAKLQTEHPRTSCGCWDLPGVMGLWDAGVTRIPGVVGFLVALDSAKFVCTRGGQTPPNHMGLNPITYSQ